MAPSASFDALDRVRKSFETQGFMKKLGVRLASVGAGTCELTVDFDETMTQQHGFFHAGVSATLGDNAAGYAAYTLMPENSTVMTTEFKINMIAPAKGERLVARSRVIKPGRTLSIVQSDIYGVAGGRETHAAIMLVTAICLMNKPDAVSAPGNEG